MIDQKFYSLKIIVEIWIAVALQTAVYKFNQLKYEVTQTVWILHEQMIT